MNLGDIFFGFRGDSQQLIADAQKGGAKAGDAGSKSFGDTFKRGAKVIGAAFAGALSVALLGRFAALERATADFRAETGATAEEAERAGKAINDMAGRNLQPIEEIGRTLTKVRTDLGLTGDEAEQTAEKFLRFGRATKQDAAEAVLAFDDILDAWGLEATEAGAIMDALILSHQKYGGSIAANQDMLNQLAPTLKAANMTWEDGLGLLNLFARAGVGAEAAATGLNRALSKVESPEELQALLEDISATTDDFARAQKAAELFGNRAGPKLANALADANGDLGAFKVSLDEAAGATDRAADASMTMVDRIRQAFSGFTSFMVETLGPAGPVLMAVSSLGTLFAPALSRVWKRLVGNAGLKAAIGLAGGAAAAAYSAGAAVVGVLETALVSLWGKIALSPRIATAVRAAAMAAGKMFGPAMVVGIALADWPDINQPVEELVRFQKAIIEKGFGDQDTWDLAKRMLAEKVRLITEEGLDPADAEARALTFVEGIASGIESFDLPIPDFHPFTTKIGEAGREAGEGLAEGIGDGAMEATQAIQRFVEAWDEFASLDDPGLVALVHDNLALIRSEFARLPEDVQAALSDMGVRATVGIKEAFGVIGTGIRDGLATIVADIQQRAAWREAGIGFAFALTEGVRQGVKDSVSNLQGAVTELRAMLDFDWGAEAGFALGKAFGQSTARGLRSSEPEVRERAEGIALAGLEALSKAGRTGPRAGDRIGQTLGKLYASGLTRSEVEARLAGEGVNLAALEEVAGKAGWGPAGGNVGGAWVKGVKGKKPESRTAGGALNDAAQTAAANAQGWETGGGNVAGAWVTGFMNALGTLKSQLEGFLGGIWDLMGGGSPPAKGPLHEIDTGGFHVGRAWRDGLLAGMAIDAPLTAALSLTAPLTLIPQMGGLAGMSSHQVVEHRHTIDAEGARNLRSAGFDEGGVARLLVDAARGAGARYSDPRRS